MKAYYIKYKMHSADSVKGLQVLADSKRWAYMNAVYVDIFEREGSLPYSAWVVSVTYNNGNRREFNTFEGMPY